jgi:hypothetical protein
MTGLIDRQTKLRFRWPRLAVSTAASLRRAACAVEAGTTRDEIVVAATFRS